MTSKKEYTREESLAIVRTEAGKRGLSAEASAVLERIMMVESNGDASVKADGSRALGLFQVIPDTWNEWAEKLGLDKTNSKNGDGRLDPVQQAKFGIAFTQSNESKLTVALDRKPSSGEIYLAHFLGVGGGKVNGAIDVIKEAEKNPNTPIKGFLSDEVLAANHKIRLKLKDGKELAFKDFTVADLGNWAEGKMDHKLRYNTERSNDYKTKGDSIPEAIGDMVMTIIKGAISLVTSMVQGLGNLLSPSTPPKAPPAVASKTSPTQLG
jgi:hypothetical protein